MLKVIISGGGTGGHVFPAIAIADAIRERVPSADILFVGARGKLEMEKVPQAGYTIVGLDISGIQRRLTVKNLLFPFKLAISSVRAWFIIRRFRPDVAVGVGGYASGPVLRMAGLQGIPTVLQEQNSYAGLTNRMLAARACRICVAYEGMNAFFPSDRIIITGNPVRQSLVNNRMSQAEARKAMGLRPDAPVVFLFGGSLGARTLNEAVMHHAAAIEAMDNVTFIWQVGKIYHDQCSRHPLAARNHVRMISFVENMDLTYAAADVVVCRAGALTISELAIVGKAAILVPSPNVADDHQTANARALSEKGAAILLPDREAKERLIEKIKELLDDTAQRNRMEEQLRTFARPDAAGAIAEEVFTCCKKEYDAVR